MASFLNYVFMYTYTGGFTTATSGAFGSLRTYNHIFIKILNMFSCRHNMEEEVDSDREEGPGDMLQAWLGELDTLKKVSRRQ